MTATDELLSTGNHSPVTFEALRRELDQDQILEFAMLVSHYVMGGMMLSVAGCEIEPAFRTRSARLTKAVDPMPTASTYRAVGTHPMRSRSSITAPRWRWCDSELPRSSAAPARRCHHDHRDRSVGDTRISLNLLAIDPEEVSEHRAGTFRTRVPKGPIHPICTVLTAKYVVLQAISRT
jgi:hypothetical protein